MLFKEKSRLNLSVSLTYLNKTYVLLLELRSMSPYKGALLPSILAPAAET